MSFDRISKQCIQILYNIFFNNMALFYAAAHQPFKSVSEHSTRAILVLISAVENNADTTDLTLKRLW